VQELGCHGIVESGVFGPHSLADTSPRRGAKTRSGAPCRCTRHVEREGLLVHPVPDDGGTSTGPKTPGD
jgi:hypothetical protein